MPFTNILNKLNLSQDVINLANGKVKFPKFTFETPAQPIFAFIPKLIPILGNNNWPGFIGVYYDWFNPTEIKYISYYCESNTYYEIAFNYKQLIVFLAFNFYLNLPEIEEAGEFCKNVGLCERNEIEEYFKGLNCIEDLKKHSVFKNKIPLSIIEPDKGFELTNEFNLNFIENEIMNGNYLNAWNIITTSNIEPAIVKKYMIFFEKKCDNPLFEEYIKVWSKYQ